MININYGRNKELMSACSPLSEYAWLIEQIRKNNECMDIEAAIDSALDDMPEDFGLKKLLIANKAEVKQMCITEYNEAEAMEQFREERRKEGILGMISALRDLDIPDRTILKKLEEKFLLTKEESRKYLNR